MRNEKLIDALVSAIYRKFRANDAKGETWKNIDNDTMSDRIQNEITELEEAVHYENYDNAIDEAADVAIYAAFYADPERITKPREKIKPKIYRHPAKDWGG